MSEVLKSAVQSLLEPIPGDDPAGASLRYETVYQKITEARREDDASLPQGTWQRALKQSDWNAVEQLCSEVLIHESKDLQIAAWLAEAWLHLKGVQGLTQGLVLVEGLCTTYWEVVHPRVEDGDIEYRVAPFEWINDNLSLALRLKVSLAEGAGDMTEDGLTLAAWEEVLRMENLSRKNAAVAKGAAGSAKLSRPVFMSAVALTNKSVFHRLLGDIGECTEAAASLERVMREKLEGDSPGLGKVLAALTAISKTVREFGGEPMPEPAPKPKVTEAQRSGASPREPTWVGTKSKEQAMAESAMADKEAPGLRPAVEPASGLSPIRSREEAYRRLSEAAEYLQRVEPHSPTSYLVMRAVSWGTMPLHQLLDELLQNKGDLQQLQELLGMRPESE